MILCLHTFCLYCTRTQMEFQQKHDKKILQKKHPKRLLRPEGAHRRRAGRPRRPAASTPFGLTAVGEQSKSPSLANTQRCVLVGRRGRLGRTRTLAEEPEILTASHLCDFLFGGRVLPRKRGYVGTQVVRLCQSQNRLLVLRSCFYVCADFFEGRTYVTSGLELCHSSQSAVAFGITYQVATIHVRRQERILEFK